MTKRLMIAALLSMFCASAFGQDASCVQWLDQEVQKLNAEEQVDLCGETAGKPVLLVNTASYCGFTYQFTGLEALYQKYKDRGLAVVGFPSDDFNQEDDNTEKTAEVCYVNHGVTFPMSDPVQVTGDEAHPVFKHLNMATSQPDWNFNKYLVDREGNVVAKFGSRVEPDSAELQGAIEKLL